jgi:hypothetical protein
MSVDYHRKSVNNQPISQIGVSSTIWFRFLSKQFSLLPTTRPNSMPKSTSAPSTGEKLLRAIKEAEAEGLASRTAEAVERYQSSSANDNTEDLDFYPEVPKEETGLHSQESSSVSGGALWARHIIDVNTLLVFTRGDGEVVTIRKSPTGEGWLIDYDGPVEVWPL